MGEKEEYGKRLNKAKCTFGSMEQYLNIPLDHGVYFQDDDHPMLNANDHVRDQHILQFGRCTSETNPMNMATDVLSNVFPILKLVDMAKEAMGSDGCKCKPMTLTSWFDGDKCNGLDGAPGLTECSKCLCLYGGVISIVKEEEQATTDNPDDEMQEPVDVLDSVPAAMKAKINQMNAAQGMNEDAADFYSCEKGGAGEGMSKASSSGKKGIESIGGMSALQCSPEMSMENKIYNDTQIPDFAYMNEAGYLTDAMGIAGFNFAGTSALALGGIAMGMYNVMRALEYEMMMSEMIAMMEGFQTIPGYVDVGPTAVNMSTMGKGLEKCGFQPGFLSAADFLDNMSAMKEGDVAVLAESNMQPFSTGREFTTFKKCGADVICMEAQEKSSVKLLSGVNLQKSMVMTVSASKIK